MGYGSIYAESWWGNTDEFSTSWGTVYPFNAGGSDIFADTNTILADSSTIKADATEF
jgi:hypothetical protein